MSRGEGERAGGEAAAGSGEDDVPREPDAEPDAEPAPEAVAAENDEEDLGDEDSEEDEEDEEDDETEYAWLSEASEDSSDGEFIEDDEEDEDDAFDSEPSDFDDDAMHFEIEGDVDFVHDEDPEHAADPEAVQGADGSNPTNPRDALEERGCYLLPDGEPIPSSTGMNHRQGADSVGAASPGRLLVTGAKDVRLLDADESSATRGQVLASTEQLPFDVYSVTYDADSSLVAVCGAADADGDINLAVFKVAQGEENKDARRESRDGDAADPAARAAGSAAMFVRVADCGVGATEGRYHTREMLNCVRFGKLLDDADPNAPPRSVLLCASQDGNCYVYALDVKSDAGGGGFERSDGSPTRAVSRSVESDGGQGGRGPRRRARLDARLALVTTIELPCACNAAASSPDGAFAACVGDFESVALRGHRTYGYDLEAYKTLQTLHSNSGHSNSEADTFTCHVPIDGDARSAGVVLGEPEGGMYVAWSGDSRYVAATTDSMCVCAVWRVGERASETTRVAYLYNHAHPCLPVTFLPSDPSVVVWAERGGRVHAYDLRRAEARARAARARGEPLEAVDMSPPKSRRGDGGSLHGVAGGMSAAIGALEMLHPDELPAEDERADALTETIVASMDSETRRARVEKAKRESAVLARRLQHWPVMETETSSNPENAENTHHRAQFRVLRELHRLSIELEMLRGKTGAAERRFVQTVRRRVRGVFVTGVCAVTAPAPPRRASNLSSNDTALGPAALRTRPPPHDLVFVGVPSGVLRFRAPTAWLPDYNHGDFPAAFRAAARAFLTCAEADTRRLRRAREGKGDDFQESESGVSLGDMPQEVLLRVLALAAVPISDWIEESAAGSIR